MKIIHSIQKAIITGLYKWTKKIHFNTGAVVKDLRQYLYFMDFEERESDIYITTFLKSGTTWMQVILYNMLISEDMSFDHIYDVSPWPRNEAFKNNTAERVNELPSPRILKTHDKYDFFHKKVKGKFIHMVRDGKDVAVSLFHHNRNYQDPTLTFDKSFENHFAKSDGKRMNWFSFNRDWFTNKNNFDILYVSYEMLKNDFDNTVQKVATHLGVALDDKKMAAIKKHSSFDYMKEHESKFGEKPLVTTQLVFDQFIRKGKMGEGKEYLNDQQKAIFQVKFDKMIKPHLPK